MTKSLRAWLVAGCAVAVLGAVLARPSLLERIGPQAEASGAPELDEMWHALSTYRTFYGSAGVGMLRVDASIPAFTLDVHGHRRAVVLGASREERSRRGATGRLSWNGQELFWAPTGEEPILLPAVYEDRVAEVWAHLRAGTGEGFTLTPATEQQRPVGLLPPRAALVPYVVDTPFDWHDGWRLLVWVENGRAMFFGVTDLDGQPLELGGNILGQVGFNPASSGIIRDVPLDPDLLDPWAPEHPDQHAFQNPLSQVRAPHGEVRLRHWTDAMYHHNLRRVWFEAEHVQGDLGNQVYVATCDDGPALHKESIHTQWTVPDDAETVTRLASAQAACDSVHFHMGIRPWVESFGPHVRSCVEGEWRMENTATDPPTLLWTKDVDLCERDDSQGVPLFRDADMPMSADLSQLRIVFEGAASVECLAEGERGGRATLRQTTFRTRTDHRVHAPLLSWDCYPGWNPVDPD